MIKIICKIKIKCQDKERNFNLVEVVEADTTNIIMIANRQKEERGKRTRKSKRELKVTVRSRIVAKVNKRLKAMEKVVMKRNKLPELAA